MNLQLVVTLTLCIEPVLALTLRNDVIFDTLFDWRRVSTTFPEGHKLIGLNQGFFAAIY